MYDRIKLACDLLCDTHKPRYLASLVNAVSALVGKQPMNNARRQALCEALYQSSDATRNDFEIVNGKVYIGSPMYIDPEELARRMIW